MAISIPIVTEFVGTGIEKAKKEFSQLEGVGKKAQFAIKKAAVPAAAALTAVGAALFDATKGAIEDAAAQDLLANNLRKTTGATDAQIASTEDWISTQGQLLGVADDELRPALAKLAKATGSVTEAQKLATQAMDIATATGKPLNTVVQALEKAYGGNMTALAKLAPEYREMIKDGASFEEVMAKIAGTTGGAASEAANTAAGQFKRMSLQFSETKESIGAALLPALEKVLPYLTKFADWAAKNPTLFLTVAGAIAAIAASIMAVNLAMALNPFSAIAAGIALLVVGVIAAYNKFETFRNVVRSVVNGIASYFEFMVNAWATAINLVIRGINLVKPGKDIPSIGKINIGRLGEEDATRGLANSRIVALAQGGIVTAPTLAMVGEGGEPEAVIPLSRMGDFGMGGGTNVTIHVNGGDPNAVVSALRTYMRQNGSVPIRVSNIY
jgi:hypothetical protein